MFRAALLALCACHGVYSDPNPPFDPGPLTAADGGATGMEDQTVDLAPVFARDSIPEPQQTRFELLEPPAHGTVNAGYSVYGGGTYQPFPGFHGMDSFRYRISDSRGRTADATATIAVQSDQVPFEQGMVVDQTPVHGLVAGDVDGDGKTDLVTTDGTGVLVYLNHSTPGNYQLDLTEVGAGHSPRAVVLADLDGDSRLDIAVAGADGVVVLRNATTTGTLAFDAPVVLAAGYATTVAVGDIDRDGKLDLLSLDADGPSLDVRLNQSVPDQLAFGVRTSFAVGANPIALQAVDVDHAGGVDVVVLAAGAQQLSIFVNATTVGATAAAFAARVDRTTGDAPKQMIVTYIGDGYPWIVVIDEDSGLWMYPNASGTYVDANVHALPYAHSTGVAAVGVDSGGFVVGYEGYGGPGILQQATATPTNHVTTTDMTVGLIDSAKELSPEAATGMVEIDLDGTAPAELAVASGYSTNGDGQTGLLILFGL
jgi:hypothetical protein